MGYFPKTYNDGIAPVGVNGYLQKLLRVLQPVLSFWHNDNICFKKMLVFVLFSMKTDMFTVRLLYYHIYGKLRF